VIGSWQMVFKYIGYCFLIKPDWHNGQERGVNRQPPTANRQPPTANRQKLFSNKKI